MAESPISSSSLLSVKWTTLIILFALHLLKYQFLIGFDFLFYYKSLFYIEALRKLLLLRKLDYYMFLWFLKLSSIQKNVGEAGRSM